MKAYVVIRVSLHIIFVYGGYFKAGAVKQQTTFFPCHLGRDFLHLTDGRSNPAEPNLVAVASEEALSLNWGWAEQS